LSRNLLKLKKKMPIPLTSDGNLPLRGD